MRPGALALSVVLLAANGFFVWAEFALIAARKTRMEQLAAEGRVLAKVALASMRELSLMLSGSQLGITMASLGLGFVAEPAVAQGIETLIAPHLALPGRVVHTIAVVIALTIVVFFHMVVGEMVPKNIAISEPERSALVLAIPIRVYTSLFRPVIHVLNGAANLGLRLVRVQPRDELLVAHSAAEIATMLAASRREGLIEEFAHELLSGALRFHERTVRTVMIPRARVTALSSTSTPADAERLALETGHSRYPVFGDADDDRALGFVHVKDLLSVPDDERSEPIPDEAVRPVLAVPEDATLHEVMLTMRREKTHFATVVDADGRVLGIVTLEDVLEELVGDIRDEHDIATAARRRLRRRR